MKKFWRGQAKKFGSQVKTVNFDPLYEELEIYYLEQLVKDRELVCDLGCGNGRTLLHLAHRRKRSKFYGTDFIKEMIDIAQKQKQRQGLRNINFATADATTRRVRTLLNLKFDKVITKRLLINLKGKDKFKAVENIHHLLKKKGIYIMIECFIEPLDRINRIRKETGLEEIKAKRFNEYLDAGFLKRISSSFDVKEVIDFGGLYYFTSRIYNAYLAKGKPDYHAPINKLALKLTKMGLNVLCGYSPEVILVLQKK